MAWDATGGCWKPTLPCSDLCAAVGGTCEVGMQGAYQVLSMCVVRGTHLVLLVLAALVCVEYIYVCIVVLGAHLVLSVLAALVVCIGYMCCGASAPGAFSACCTCRMCWIYMKWGAWRAPDARGEWPL